MKAFLTLSVVLLVQSVRADPFGDEVAALKVRFPEGKHLSSNELRQVVELAHYAGMKWVTEVRPMRSQSGDVGLLLSTADIKEGRRISREELTVWPLEWRRDKTQPHRYVTGKTQDGFGLGTSSVHRRQWATFMIDGKEARLECRRETDLAKADKALAALLAGRVEYATGDARAKSSSINFHAPRYVAVEAGQVRMGFGHSDPLCGYSIGGQMKGDTFVIEYVSEGCA